MRGNITRRGKASWQIKFDLGTVNGKRATRYATVRGTYKDAQKELTRLLSEADKGMLVDPSKLTVAEYLRNWLGQQHGLAPASIQRYADIIERQTIPIIGHVDLQKLKPIHIRNWLDGMIAAKLSARTVSHAHRVIRTALQHAVDLELLSRNVAGVPKSPKVEDDEVEILNAEDIRRVRLALDGNAIYAIVALALATGMRRGELLALSWQDIDLDAAEVKVTRSLEQTKAGGLRFKAPKSKHGRRVISIPKNTVEELRTHRRRQLELRMALGQGGKPELVFSESEGKPISPNYVSILWRRATKGIVNVRFHALRHTHASALIAGGVDIVTVSRRLGHWSPAFTLKTYAHLFTERKTAAAAIAKMIG
jgi:integrase